VVKAEFELNWAEKQRNTLGKESKNNDILSKEKNLSDLRELLTVVREYFTDVQKVKDFDNTAKSKTKVLPVQTVDDDMILDEYESEEEYEISEKEDQKEKDLVSLPPSLPSPPVLGSLLLDQETTRNDDDAHFFSAAPSLPSVLLAKKLKKKMKKKKKKAKKRWSKIGQVVFGFNKISTGTSNNGIEMKEKAKSLREVRLEFGASSEEYQEAAKTFQKEMQDNVDILAEKKKKKKKKKKVTKRWSTIEVDV
jgi:hypothetical protein